MTGGKPGRIFSLLDWCWPFPLGFLAGTIAFSVAAGTWLMFRDHQPPLRRRPLIQSGAPEVAANGPPASSAPAQSAAPALPDSTTAQSGQTPGSRTEQAIPSATAARQESAAPISPSKLERPIERTSVPREEPSPRKVPLTVPARPQPVQPKAQPQPAAPQLSSEQQAELADRLTLGRFLMDRKDYHAAITEFQAALAINPSNREAKAAVEQAKEASKNQEPTPQP